jgi:hypothetical protein
MAVSLEVLHEQALRTFDRHRNWGAVSRQCSDELIQPRDIVSDAKLWLEARTVDDAELVLGRAPVDPGGPSSLSFHETSDLGRAISVADPPGAHPGARGTTPTGRSKVRHRRAGRVCRWTSPVTLPRSSSRRRR